MDLDDSVSEEPVPKKGGKGELFEYGDYGSSDEEDEQAMRKRLVEESDEENQLQAHMDGDSDQMSDI